MYKNTLKKFFFNVLSKKSFLWEGTWMKISNLYIQLQLNTSANNFTE